MSKHASVLFYDDSECDMCDKKGITAHIDTLSGHVTVICIECIVRILNEAPPKD